MSLDIAGNDLMLGIVVAVVVLIVLDLVVAGGGVMTGTVQAVCTPWGGLLSLLLLVFVLVAVFS